MVVVVAVPCVGRHKVGGCWRRRRRSSGRRSWEVGFIRMMMMMMMFMTVVTTMSRWWFQNGGDGGDGFPPASSSVVVEVAAFVVVSPTSPLPKQWPRRRQPTVPPVVPWYHHLGTDHHHDKVWDDAIEVAMEEDDDEDDEDDEDVILLTLPPPRLWDDDVPTPPPPSPPNTADDAEFPTPLLPQGLPKGFCIVQQYTYLPNDVTRQKLLELMTTMDTTDTSSNTSSNSNRSSNSSSVNPITVVMNSDRVHALGLEDVHNVTLPLALMMLDPITYPSFSRARKACRKGNVLVIRGSNTTTTTTTTTTTDTNRNRKNNTDHDGDDDDDDEDDTTKFIGRVGDRVYTGDTVAIQVRMGNGDRFAIMSAGPTKAPPFDVPVIYQDDHYALVNKPAGVVCYRQGSGSSGWLSIRAALPFVLDPPARGTYAVLRRPASVHRLDKPTSGLLCIVKTKPAMVHMSKQFHDRVVQKTYTAIVNGIPEENSNAWITSQEAVLKYGVDTNGDTDPEDTPWQLIDSPLDNQHAVTLWRVRQYVPSLRARDGTITLVECQPQTGRYHQLRRHMAWVANRALVGDAEYDGNHPSAIALRGNGLFLCATGITHEHPYYNTLDGRLEWNRCHPTKVHEEEDSPEDNPNHHHHNNNTNKNSNRTVLWYNAHTDKVMVSAAIEAPTKFRSLLQREGERYQKFHAVT